MRGIQKRTRPGIADYWMYGDGLTVLKMPVMISDRGSRGLNFLPTHHIIAWARRVCARGEITLKDIEIRYKEMRLKK